jgi:anaerobic ribonucleoside-triphosphate reductase
LIEKPHSFSTACNVATQVVAQVASNQYGGQSITLSHLAPFVDISRKKIRAEVEEELSGLDFIDGIGYLVDEITEKVKYEITSAPVGTLVNYYDREIRVMCPDDTKWIKQNVGSTGNSNMYYMGFKAYAPNGAVSFREDDKEIIEDQTMYYFENNDFTGVDNLGRKYSIVWLALAKYDEATNEWTYFGKTSSTSKYIGWYYTVEWYNADGKVIASDQIRINLSNEDCHNAIEPYYMSKYVTDAQLTALEENINLINESYTWSEM